jgi:hypothetical protein
MNDNIRELGPTTTGDVYRINPMDRDTGGHGHQPFDTLAGSDEEEEQARKKKEMEAQRQEAARQARLLDDRLSLSASALKAMEEAGRAVVGEAGAPHAAAAAPQRPPAGAPDRQTETDGGEPADESGAPASQDPSRPPPPRIDFVA